MPSQASVSHLLDATCRCHLGLLWHTSALLSQLDTLALPSRLDTLDLPSRLETSLLSRLDGCGQRPPCSPELQCLPERGQVQQGGSRGPAACQPTHLSQVLLQAFKFMSTAANVNVLNPSYGSVPPQAVLRWLTEADQTMQDADNLLGMQRVRWAVESGAGVHTHTHTRMHTHTNSA